MVDARESLKYKQELLPEDSEIVAEAHFKLSLALEFASVTSQGDEDGAAAGAAPKEINQELRDEAVKEMEAAISSTKMKLQNKEVELATLHSPEDNEATRRAIFNTKEVIADMEQRVSLRPFLLVNYVHSQNVCDTNAKTCAARRPPRSTHRCPSRARRRPYGRHPGCSAG